MFYTLQATPLVAGLAVAGAAMAARYGLQAWNAVKAGGGPKLRKYYEGGFAAAMTKREAALILGESTLPDRAATSA